MPKLLYVGPATTGIAACDTATNPDFPTLQPTNWPPSVVEGDETIHSHQPGVEACSQPVIKVDPSRSGRVAVS